MPAANIATVVTAALLDTDNGTESLPSIFERFYQVDNSATRKFGGTGRGLALVQRLVRAHGAEVIVESEVGKGTRFSLLWPVTPTAADGTGA